MIKMLHSPFSDFTRSAMQKKWHPTHKKTTDCQLKMLLILGNMILCHVRLGDFHLWLQL